MYAIRYTQENGNVRDSKLYHTKGGVKQVLNFEKKHRSYYRIAKVDVLEYDLVLNREVSEDQFLSEKKTEEAYNVWSVNTESRYYKSTIEQALNHYRKEHGLSESDTLIWEKINVVNL